jgi:hypothetical protein
MNDRARCARWGVSARPRLLAIRTMRCCAPASVRTVFGHGIGLTQAEVRAAAPRRLDSTISIIVSLGGNSAGPGSGMLVSTMRCTTGGVAHDQFAEAIRAAGLWSSDSETRKFGRGQRHGTGCRSGPHQGESGHPSGRRHHSPRPVAETFNGADGGGRLLV